MLLNLYEKKWTHGLRVKYFEQHKHGNENTVQSMLDLAKQYSKSVKDEVSIPMEKLALSNVGKIDAKRRLDTNLNELMSENVNQVMGMMLDTIVFRDTKEVNEDDEDAMED